jgi:hypothetical protein
MQKIYTVKVKIPAAPLMLERTFFFTSEDSQTKFYEGAVHKGYTVIACGSQRLFTADEALVECLLEAASVEAPHA